MADCATLTLVKNVLVDVIKVNPPTVFLLFYEQFNQNNETMVA